jgi:hypothetical protein
MSDQYLPTPDEQLPAQAEGQEDVQAQESERVDWKERAIRLEERMRVFEERAAPVPPALRDPVGELERAIAEKEASLPKYEAQRAESFFERETAKEELQKLRHQLVEARLGQQQQYVAEAQSRTVLAEYKSRLAGNPDFRAIEGQFDQMVARLEPGLRSNPAMLEMLRKNLEYDHLRAQANRGAPGKPPAAPNAAYQPQAGAQRAKGPMPAWRSEEDRKVGEYYIQRGIISGPEEFYDPRFNDRSPSANNNGTAIYDIPEPKRGWRKA